MGIKVRGSPEVFVIGVNPKGLIFVQAGQAGDGTRTGLIYMSREKSPRKHRNRNQTLDKSKAGAVP